ncbi:hypothetical protein HZA73_07100 [candidate division TA06 bacterium]|nr:hypothetical protein [candidate division TA06 bacterium]
MTERVLGSTIQCAGCGRTFGTIQQSHIALCPGLHNMGIRKRKEYAARFGSTMSSEHKKAIKKTIVTVNNSRTKEERTECAKVGHQKAIEKYPNLSSMGGIRGAPALWARPGQKERHKIRIQKIRLQGKLFKEPNSFEREFQNFLGHQVIEFTSNKKNRSYILPSGKSITPDFTVIGNNKLVIEVMTHSRPNYEAERIADCDIVGKKCFVVWRKEYLANPRQLLLKVLLFIKQNSTGIQWRRILCTLKDDTKSVLMNHECLTIAGKPALTNSKYTITSLKNRSSDRQNNTNRRPNNDNVNLGLTP